MQASAILQAGVNRFRFVHAFRVPTTCSSSAGFVRAESAKVLRHGKNRGIARRGPDCAVRYAHTGTSAISLALGLLLPQGWVRWP